MRDRLILLPGWGLGVSPMEPLAAALQGLDEHLKVDIEPLPELDSSDLQDWLDELDGSIPPHLWLGGRSLGGNGGLLRARGQGPAAVRRRSADGRGAGVPVAGG